MRSILAHRETGCGWHPRHPVVCVIDVVGIGTILGLLAVYRPPIVTATLPAVIVLQYVVSFLHHWLPYSEMRSKLDRSTISAVIGATYVPYWASLLPIQEATQRLPWVGVATLLGCLLVLFNASDKLISVFWAVFASTGLVISFWELQTWLPHPALVAFWFGSTLYGAQQIVFALRYPDPLPELLGYREVQHLLLLAATTIASVIVLQYT